MKHGLGDLTDHLFAQLDRLADGNMTAEQIDQEVKRTEAIVKVSRIPGWRNIETAPRDGTAILASGLDHGNGPSRHYSVVEWMDFGCESGWYPDEDADPLTYLSHWMPLPAPPSEGVEP